MYNRPSWRASINGTLLVQTFFVLGGFFMARSANFKKVLNLKEIFRMIALRFLRLIPIYGLVILFMTSAFKYLGDGPIWRRLKESQEITCRENYWTNLLFINNFVNPSKIVRTSYLVNLSINSNFLISACLNHITSQLIFNCLSLEFFLLRF